MDYRIWELQEQLERLEQNPDKPQVITLLPSDAKWFAKQAEKVGELKGRLSDAHENIEIFKNDFHDCRKKAKGYRKQLELIRNDTHCEDEEFVSVKHVIRKRAEKGLKGE